MATKRAGKSAKRIKTLPVKSLTARREKAVKGGTNPSNDKKFKLPESFRDGTSNTI